MSKPAREHVVAAETFLLIVEHEVHCPCCHRANELEEMALHYANVADMERERAKVMGWYVGLCWLVVVGYVVARVVW